ncbi:CTI6 Histone deacetylase complex subunit CTI6 [Candida maltosa Xu316]
MSRRSGRKDTEDSIIDDEEEDIVEEDEVTRCICGKDELTAKLINPELESFLKRNYRIEIDQGLFISCEKCSVWQHGYCVGLFENNEVPDKYFCEQCKPEFHISVKYDGYSKRTLYKPVNDKRKKLEQMPFNSAEETKRRPKNNAPSPAPSAPSQQQQQQQQLEQQPQEQQEQPANHKEKRKERRHLHHHRHEDDEEEYNEQLKRALRESARESGIKVSESEANDAAVKKEEVVTITEENTHIDQKVEASESEVNDNTDTESNLEGGEKLAKPRVKETSKGVKRRKRTPPQSSGSNETKRSRESTVDALSKEELIQQPSKPRFVNQKSSIFELRKRTIAILEWIGRSQMELEEEKEQKLELFSFLSDEDDKEKREKAIQDTLQLKETFDDNLFRMERLTERILAWQDKFGKYAT